MQYPPAEWQIRCEDQFEIDGAELSSAPLSGRLHLQVDKSGQVNGCFKISLNGSQTLKVDVPAEKVLIMGGAASYRLRMERRPQDIEIRLNATSSDWFDLENRY